MWFSFIFFPLAILLPFVIISLLFRLLSFNRRRLGNRGGLELGRLLPGSGKINKASNDEEFEVYIFRLAARKKGRLTSAQIVVDSGLPMSEVDRRMSGLVDSVHVCMEIDETGLIIYEFPEFRT